MEESTLFAIPNPPGACHSRALASRIETEHVA